MRDVDFMLLVVYVNTKRVRMSVEMKLYCLNVAGNLLYSPFGNHHFILFGRNEMKSNF